MDESFDEDDRYEEHEVPDVIPSEDDVVQDDDITLDDSSVTFCGHQQPVFCIDIVSLKLVFTTYCERWRHGFKISSNYWK